MGADCSTTPGSIPLASARLSGWGSARQLTRWVKQSSLLGDNEWNASYAPPPPRARTTCERRFEPDDPEALEHLEEQGYVIFKEVLGPEEVKHAVDLFWKWVEEFTARRVCRGCPKTWGTSSWPGNPANGIFAAGGLGQSPFMWNVRLQPRLLRAFAGIWKLDKVEDLLMSFDGACAFRPTEVDPSWRTRGNWFHVDQNGRKTGSDHLCVQGFVTLLDSSADTGGLAVLPGSHRRHEDLFRRWPAAQDSDFFPVPRSDPLLVGASAIHPHLVCAKAGDLVLWDSRCVHCNIPAPHLLDTVRLDSALADAGLSKAVAPLCRGLTSVADAVWLFHHLSRPDVSGDFHTNLLQWGVPQEVLLPLTEQFKLWAASLDDRIQHEVESFVPTEVTPPSSPWSPEERETKKTLQEVDMDSEVDQDTALMLRNTVQKHLAAHFDKLHAFSGIEEPEPSRSPPLLHQQGPQQQVRQPTGRSCEASINDCELQRLVAYVCALPRCTASPTVRHLRQQGLLLGATTTHWPNRCEVIAASPGAFGAVKPLDLPPLALRLVGCDGSTVAEMHEELEETRLDLYGPNLGPSIKLGSSRTEL